MAFRDGHCSPKSNKLLYETDEQKKGGGEGLHEWRERERGTDTYVYVDTYVRTCLYLICLWRWSCLVLFCLLASSGDIFVKEGERERGINLKPESKIIGR
jgi:hypothetical protein